MNGARGPPREGGGVRREGREERGEGGEGREKGEERGERGERRKKGEERGERRRGERGEGERGEGKGEREGKGGERRRGGRERGGGGGKDGRGDDQHVDLAIMSKFAKLTEKDQLKVELQSLGVENPTVGR